MGLNHRGMPLGQDRTDQSYKEVRPDQRRDSGAGRVRVQVSVGTKVSSVSYILDIEVCSLRRARNEDTRGSWKVLQDTIVSNRMSNNSRAF